MIEYRGSEGSGFDERLKREGLIFYRVDKSIKGNFSGPPDEIYVLREEGQSVYNAYYNGESGRTEFSEFEENDAECVYRFGTILNGKEYELSGGYQENNSVTVDFIKELEDKAVGTHTLFVDIKNTNTGEVTRTEISDYVIDGMYVSNISTNLASPQKLGATIEFSATVQKEEVTEDNTYQFTVEKDGKEENLTMNSKYTASWTPTEAGIYTIRYRVVDANGIPVLKEIQYIIGTDETAYILYNNDSWNQAYMHYKIDGEEWTTAPGVLMADSNVEGYSWIYPLELGNKEATVAFNDGNDNWDDNGSKNYTIAVGVNSIGGDDKTLSALDITATNIQKRNSKFTLSLEGGIAPYTCDYEVRRKDDDTIGTQKTGIQFSTEQYIIEPNEYKSGEYILSVTITDSYGQTLTKEMDFELEPFIITDIESSVASPQKVGTEWLHMEVCDRIRRRKRSDCML